MFPLHSGDELCFKASSSTHQQQYIIPQDLDWGNASIDGSDITKDTGESHRRKSCPMMNTDKISHDNNNNNNNINNRKLMHKDIERQRRQVMTTHYASLRTLLPLEFIKGNRSISDQLNVAVNYIKYLEKKIKELGVKRDELKRLSNLSTPAASKIETSDQDTSSSNNCFTIRPSLVGMEIAYTCRYSEQELPLSKVLDVLLDEGLCVVNCVSTRVGDRLLHTIQTEVKDPSSFILRELQEKLTQVK